MSRTRLVAACWATRKPINAHAGNARDFFLASARCSSGRYLSFPLRRTRSSPKFANWLALCIGAKGRGGERRRFRQSLPVDRMDYARPLFGLQPRLFDRQPVLCVALADQIGKIRAVGQHTWEILPVFREGSLPENEKHHD